MLLYEQGKWFGTTDITDTIPTANTGKHSFLLGRTPVSQMGVENNPKKSTAKCTQAWAGFKLNLQSLYTICSRIVPLSFTTKLQGCVLITSVSGALWLMTLHAIRASGCPQLWERCLFWKIAWKCARKHQFLNHAVTRRKAKQKERTFYLEFRNDWTEQNAINILYLLAVPLDFVLTSAKMKRKWAQISLALSWLCCAEFLCWSHQEQGILGPSALPPGNSMLWGSNECARRVEAREFFDLAFQTKHTQCSRCNAMSACYQDVGIVKI